MSYQVLARKWRPRNFSTLVGQEHVVKALGHALAEQRLHHAYLFTGTRGVGKTTIARILAKALNCEQGVTPAPCGICSACREIDSGRFVDLLEVDAATNTRVDEMRQLLENAVYAPTRGRFKVYVIDEVHMLSNSAFNAMLKTLEEPPAHVKFILATTDPQKIPVTVLSRCLQFNLKQMPIAAIESHLAHILTAESIRYDALALGLIARAAEGSMRDALSLLDQAIAHGAGRLEITQVREMLGTVDSDYLIAILNALHANNADELLQIAANLALRSISFATTLQELAQLLTKIQISQFAPNTVADDPEIARFQDLVVKLTIEYVQLAYQIVVVGRSELSLAPDEYTGFVMTLLRLLAFTPSRQFKNEVRKSGIERQRASKDAGVASTQTVAASLKTVPGFGAIQHREIRAEVEQTFDAIQAPSNSTGNLCWEEIVPKLALSGLGRELAQNCELRQFDNGVCYLHLDPKMAHLQMKPAPERLQHALIEFLGVPVTLKIELLVPGRNTMAQELLREKYQAQKDAHLSIESDVFVQTVIDSFGASVDDATIKPVN